MTSALPYAGLRVLDCAESVAGQFATRLLAAFGADVVLLEPPGGSATRRMPPLRPEGGGTESLVFWHLNLGKQALVLDTRAAARARVLAGLVDGVDVVVAGDADLRGVLAPHPDVVLCEVSDFGSAGPLRGWRGSELIQQALSGTMFQSGEPDREPLYGLGHRASYATGVAAYISIAAALLARRGGHLPDGPIEVTVAETAASMGQNEATSYWYARTWSTRSHHPGFTGRLRCADGWVIVFGFGRWPEICTALDAPELAADPRFAEASARTQHWPEAVALLEACTRHRRADAVVAAAERTGAMIEKINTVDDVVRLDHLAERSFWQTVPTADGPRPALGPLFRLGDPPLWATGAAPEPSGAHSTPQWSSTERWA